MQHTCSIYVSDQLRCYTWLYSADVVKCAFEMTVFFFLLINDILVFPFSLGISVKI